jgi:hypothetical protein
MEKFCTLTYWHSLNWYWSWCIIESLPYVPILYVVTNTNIWTDIKYKYFFFYYFQPLVSFVNKLLNKLHIPDSSHVLLSVMCSLAIGSKYRCSCVISSSCMYGKIWLGYLMDLFICFLKSWTWCRMLDTFRFGGEQTCITLCVLQQLLSPSWIFMQMTNVRMLYVRLQRQCQHLNTPAALK